MLTTSVSVEEQLAWVERDLSYVPKKRAVVVLVHAPLQSRQFPDPEHYGDSSALLALLDGYARVQIISGHTHCNSVATPSRRVTEHTVGAACGGFWEGPVCLDGTPLGYKLFEVRGRRFRWRYVAAAAPERLFSVYPPDTSRCGASRPASELLVNVWDWDPQWRVEYSEDGGRTFRPMKRCGYDDPRALDPVGMRIFRYGRESADCRPSLDQGQSDGSSVPLHSPLGTGYDPCGIALRGDPDAAGRSLTRKKTVPKDGPVRPEIADDYFPAGISGA